MTVAIDNVRLAEVSERGLGSGNHSSAAAGYCVMEAVSYITRELFSDHPECACPIITAFMMSWNDGLPDDERGMLLPLIPKLVGTRGSDALAEQRSLMATDWLVRVHTPAWLRLAGLAANADALEALPEITSLAQVPSIRGPIEAARRDAGAVAGDAAWAVAGDAAWAVAWAAARAAARAAAWDAARAAARDAAWAVAGDAAGAVAWAAAWAVAWAAARDAAWDAARDAAGTKLAPTRLVLQRSAYHLVERMCDAVEA